MKHWQSWMRVNSVAHEGYDEETVAQLGQDYELAADPIDDIDLEDIGNGGE